MWPLSVHAEPELVWPSLSFTQGYQLYYGPSVAVFHVRASHLDHSIALSPCCGAHIVQGLSNVYKCLLIHSPCCGGL